MDSNFCFPALLCYSSGLVVTSKLSRVTATGRVVLHVNSPRRKLHCGTHLSILAYCIVLQNRGVLGWVSPGQLWVRTIHCSVGVGDGGTELRPPILCILLHVTSSSSNNFLSGRQRRAKRREEKIVCVCLYVREKCSAKKKNMPNPWAQSFKIISFNRLCNLICYIIFKAFK